MVSPEGTIYGEGSDVEGGFRIRGSWDLDTRSCAFTKYNRSSHGTIFEGTLDSSLRSLGGEYNNLNSDRSKSTAAIDNGYF